MLHVNVTQENIDIARESLSPAGSTHNPVSLAICDTLGEPAGRVHTWYQLGKIDHIGVKETTFPATVLTILGIWNRDREMEPFSFTVDL